ncbi:LysR family transcriptional regulator [Priestia koreensis]|uniref:LysR family transcriptional regulator n=1 Tax=Priestia koreensis TaxID=284581 RepID=A0A0M0KE53_9BACI|nr:LysR family transcriptional regulator [Priestia koreensis]KOO37121.1 LysR family transcriptional regulator [Priestia koreensis]
MRTEWLESFWITADTRSLSKASEQLHMSQPALSKQMRKLEEELGASLFKRTSSGVELTKAGEILYKEVQPLLQKLQSIQREIVLTEEWTSVTVGTWPSIASSYLPYKLAEAKTERKINVKISYSYHDIFDYLKSGEVDAALIDDQFISHTYWSKPLFTEDFYLFLNSDHPLAKKEEVSFSEFENEPLVLLPEGCDVRSSIERAYSEKGKDLPISTEIDFGQSIIGFIHANLGMSILPKIFIDHARGSHVKALKIKGIDLSRQISLVAHNDKLGKQLYALLFQ